MGMFITTLVSRDGGSYALDADRKRFVRQDVRLAAPAQRAAQPDPEDWNNIIAPVLEAGCAAQNQRYELTISSADMNQVFVEMAYIGLSNGARIEANVINVINEYNLSGSIIVPPEPVSPS